MDYQQYLPYQFQNISVSHTLNNYAIQVWNRYTKTVDTYFINTLDLIKAINIPSIDYLWTLKPNAIIKLLGDYSKNKEKIDILTININNKDVTKSLQIYKKNIYKSNLPNANSFALLIDYINQKPPNNKSNNKVKIIDYELNEIEIN